MSDLPVQDTASHPWDQLRGEPSLWYGRFCLYRDLGPGRSMTGASRAERLAKHKHPWPPNESWHRAAQTWYWRERALAWDAYKRETLTLCEYNIRLAARDRRLAIIDHNLENVSESLDAANLAGMTQDEARKALPQTRRFLVDLLTAERKEFESSIVDEEDERQTITITADDLRAAQRELDRSGWRPELDASTHVPALPDFSAAPTPNRPLSGGPPLASRTPAPKEFRLRLFVCPPLGAAGEPQISTSPSARGSLQASVDPTTCPSAQLDPATLRAAGLPVSRIFDPNRTKFCEAFARERSLRRPIELLHLDLHTNADGVEFTNGFTAPTWRIRHIDKLRVVVLAHHVGGAQIPPVFTAVPLVVTLAPALPPAAAGEFTRAFWLAVAAGDAPPAAFSAALALVPPAGQGHIASRVPG